MKDFKYIKELLANNEIMEACRLLKKTVSSEDILDEIIIQEGKYDKLLKGVRNSFVKKDFEHQETSRIVNSLIQIINKVTKAENFNNNLKDRGTSILGESKLTEKKLLSHIESGNKYYNAGIGEIIRDKRDAFALINNSVIAYKLAINKDPENPKLYVFLCYALKVLLLINYKQTDKENQNDYLTKLEEIKLYISKGKSYDQEQIYYNSFNLIIDDINKYLNQKLITEAYHIAMIIGIIVSAIFVLLSINGSVSDAATFFCMGLTFIIFIYKGESKKKEYKLLLNHIIY